MQESSFCSRKPSNISEYLESVGPQRVLLQFRSPPIMVLDRCSEEKLPSILVRSWEGSLPGGLYIETNKKENPQKEMTAAAISSDIIWYTGLGLKSLGHQIAVLAHLPSCKK